MPTFSHDGRRLHFTDSASEGEPLLLLHGLGSRGSDWQPQIDGLIDEYRLITMDFPGHGDSDPLNAPVRITDLADSALALLDHLGLARAHIVGLSLGGMVTFQILAASAERLDSLTIINSGPGIASGRWQLHLLVALRTLLIRTFGLPTLAKKIAPKLFPRADQQPLRERFLQSAACAEKNSYIHTLRAIGAFDVRKKIVGSPVPALILSADGDYTPVSFKAEYTALMGNAHLRVIKNSGHASPMDQPAQCNQMIREFLREHSVKKAKQYEKAIVNETN